MKQWIVLSIAAALLALGIACKEKPLDEETVDVGADTVAVEDNKFDSRVIEVTPGTEVTWHFEGDLTHNVVGEGWGSEPMESGSFSHRFEAPGTYDYRCTLHDNMTGRVIVSP